ncbi:MAG: hypothetical protein RLY57_107 [Candidatus Parcubacteria bacterium]|jgi:FkbM family methyltransferase
MNFIHILLKRLSFAISHGKGVTGKITLLHSLLSISKSTTPVPLTIKELAHPLYAQSGSDVAMMIEMFHEHEYAFPELTEINKIIDIGANIGSASLYFSTLFPHAKIVAVEPDPQNIIKLEMNIAAYQSITLIKGAVDSQSGYTTFYSDKNVGMSSSFIKRSPQQEPYTVTTYTINDICKQAGWDSYDLLKFDMEGAEWNIFSHRPFILPRFIIGEYHEDLTGKTVEEFLKLFPEYISQVKRIAPQRFILKLLKQ